MTKDEQLYAVILQIRPVFRALAAAVEDRLHGSGLGLPERGVLECLQAMGPQTVPALARTIGVPRQFVQRTCNALLDQGLVERVDNPAHARSSLLRLTSAGAKAFKTLRQRETTASRSLAAALSAADLAATVRVLQAMRRHYESLPRLHA